MTRVPVLGPSVSWHLEEDISRHGGRIGWLKEVGTGGLRGRGRLKSGREQEVGAARPQERGLFMIYRKEQINFFLEWKKGDTKRWERGSYNVLKWCNHKTIFTHVRSVAWEPLTLNLTSF